MSLGTWGLSGDAYGKVEPADAERVIARAVDVGITLFDTADAYGLGRMEALLGKVLAPHKDAIVLTKGGTDRTTEPPRKHFEPGQLRSSVERSLKRLGRERLDIYVLHNPSADALALGEATDTLLELKKEGKIGVWGVSAGDAEVAKVAIDKGCEVLMLAYNLLHGIDLHRVAGDVMLAGVGILAHSVLGYGLLAGLWTKERVFGDGDHRSDRWTRVELEKRVGQLDAVRFLVKGGVHSIANRCRYRRPGTQRDRDGHVRHGGDDLVGVAPVGVGDDDCKPERQCRSCHHAGGSAAALAPGDAPDETERGFDVRMRSCCPLQQQPDEFLFVEVRHRSAPGACHLICAGQSWSAFCFLATMPLRRSRPLWRWNFTAPSEMPIASAV